MITAQEAATRTSEIVDIRRQKLAIAREQFQRCSGQVAEAFIEEVLSPLVEQTTESGGSKTRYSIRLLDMFLESGGFRTNETMAADNGWTYHSSGADDDVEEFAKRFGFGQIEGWSFSVYHLGNIVGVTIDQIKVKLEELGYSASGRPDQQVKPGCKYKKEWAFDKIDVSWEKFCHL
jgi:hypothetical protein